MIKMNKMLKLLMLAACCSQMANAQSVDSISKGLSNMDDAAFTFTESQMGEDEDMSQSVTILGSNNNVYASQIGYLFSPVRFRYRAFNQKYNDIYINGAPMNDMESGIFRYSFIGGLNNITRRYDASLAFENNTFAMPNMAGSNNYNFRASNVQQGHKFSLSGANRAYTMRAMYTYGSGVSKSGWSVAASLGYRWAKEGYVDGTFYNSLSYYLGIEKFINDNHSLSFATWGNPTERASQGAATDESYWLANDYQYNPYWGYQNGHKRNSRVVNDFAPSALFTWDWKIDNALKLTTTLSGKYSMYKSTKLNYNNADNPHPDYWKNLPSSYYDVWDPTDVANRTDQNLLDWNTAYDFMSSFEANRQINWDRLYYSNKQAALQGSDALYFIQAKHNDNLTFTLSSTLNMLMSKQRTWNLGFVAMTNEGKHYQTLEDMLGASSFHNINSYAMGTYSTNSNEVQYDLNTMGVNQKGRLVYEGDKFGYDYKLSVNKAYAWSSFTSTIDRYHFMVAGRVGGTSMARKGYMKNGMFAENSYGKSGVAHFLDGGVKGSATANLGGGHAIKLGLGYQFNAPQATVAFVSPEMNNDFVANLKNEKVLSGELSYQYQNAWLRANINAYYSYLTDVTEWQNFYYDDINSFSYVSLTGIKKAHYGIEAGLDFKVTQNFNIKALGVWSDAKNLNNSTVRYLNSTSKAITEETIYNKNMREAGTPLSAYSLILNYNTDGWYFTLNGNYYDRIYLSYSPSFRYESSLVKRQKVYGDVYDNEGHFLPNAVDQSKGKGGFMLDGSIGKSIYLKNGMLSINLMVTNILNNQTIVTGGYEQSRSDYTASDNVRAYKFSKNPKKYYAFGTNGMLNITYRF